MAEAAHASGRAPGTGGNVVPALCNAFGVALLLVVIGLCVPLIVPRIMGLGVYEVVSGSMEPALPRGSVVFVRPLEPGLVEQGDVIAFDEGSATVVHRVTGNRTSLGEFTTKGDANDVEDLQPVPYEALIGVVEMHIPGLGSLMSVLASPAGKTYLLLIAACGVMLNVLAGRIRGSRRASGTG